MDAETFCLGIETLGHCSYDPENPNPYFTLGNLLSVLALLLAISQLSRPIIKFRLIAKNLRSKILIALSTIAVTSIFIATALPFMPGKKPPLIGYPVTWEVFSALLFLSIGIYIILTVTKPAKFTKTNAENYLQATLSAVAKGDEQLLSELTDEIITSVSNVTTQALKLEAINIENDQGKIDRVPNLTRVALTILDVWSDKRLCEIMVCRSPASAIEIICELKKLPHSRVGSVLSQEIINQAFENKNSILYREADYSGLGFFKNFTHICFDDWDFISGPHRPLDAWSLYRAVTEPWKIKKYISCVQIATTAYLNSKLYWDRPSAIYSAFDKISSITRAQIYTLKHLNENDLYNSTSLDTLIQISLGLEKIVDSVIQQDDFPDYEFIESSYDYLDDPSIYGVMARGIYEYFEVLATSDKHDQTIRQLAIGIWLRIFGHRSVKTSESRNEIGKRLIIHLKKKVQENLNHEQRWHPAITRLLLSMNGIYESGTYTNEESIGANFHKNFLQELKAKFPLIYQAEREFALRLLPESFEYCETENTILHRGFRNKRTILRLNKASQPANA